MDILTDMDRRDVRRELGCLLRFRPSTTESLQLPKDKDEYLNHQASRFGSQRPRHLLPISLSAKTLEPNRINSMKTYSPEIETDIAKRSKVFGIVLGLVCIPFSFLGGVLGACCPLGSFIGVLPVVLWSGFAGFLAAMFLNWGQVTHEDAIGVGTKVGLRTGRVAAGIGAGATFLISAVLGGSLYGAAGADQGGGVGGAAGGAATSIFMNLIVAAISVGIGIALGVVGGVIGAAIKRPSAPK